MFLIVSLFYVLKLIMGCTNSPSINHNRIPQNQAQNPQSVLILTLEDLLGEIYMKIILG